MSTTLIAYDFFAPPRIAFGWGRRVEVGPLARSLGARALIVWGSRRLEQQGISDEIRQSLRDANVEPIDLATIDHEPLVSDVDAATAKLLEIGSTSRDMLIAVGGGSAIDLAKALAAMATNRAGATVRDYLEGVGKGCKITEPPLPILAMPTTAGTGSEATKNAVISSYDPPFKKSLRSDLLVPRVVLVDPRLTVSLSAAMTMQTGLDAITQLIESYISRKAKPLPRALARDGLRLALPAIRTAVREPENRPAREAMAQAALLSGMALANSGLGMAHGVAAALGVHCRAPHGLACAVMLPVAVRANRDVCVAAYAELHRASGGDTALTDDRAADAFVTKIESLCAELGVPTELRRLGVEERDVPTLVAASRGASMDGNPKTLSDAELTALLEAMR